MADGEPAGKPVDNDAPISHADQLLLDPATKVPYYIRWDGEPIGFCYSPYMVREILNTSGYFDPAEIEEWDEEVNVSFGTNHVQFSGWTGSLVGGLYSAVQVRSVLCASGYFDMEEINHWNRAIVVPFGTSPFDYICTVVGKEGFSIRALYCAGRWSKVSPMLPMDKLAKRNIENGFFPKIRGKSDTFLSSTDIPPELGFDDLLLTPLIFHCHAGVDPSWASPVYSWIVDRADKLLLSKISSQLADLKNLTGKTNLLFHGTGSREHMIGSLGEGPTVIPNHRADFGSGIYLTPDFFAALCYAMYDGVVRVYDHGEGWGDLTVKVLVGAEWAQFVKRSVAWTNQSLDPPIPRPAKLQEDFIEGPVSLCHPSIFACDPPLPCKDYQHKANTAAARTLLASRLVAIIYVTHSGELMTVENIAEKREQSTSTHFEKEDISF